MIPFLFNAVILALAIFVNVSFLQEKKTSKLFFVLSTIGLIFGIIGCLLYAFDIGHNLLKLLLMAVALVLVFVGMGKPVFKQTINVIKFFFNKDDKE